MLTKTASLCATRKTLTTSVCTLRIQLIFQRHVHTVDSIHIAPSQTLTDTEYETLYNTVLCSTLVEFNQDALTPARSRISSSR